MDVPCPCALPVVPTPRRVGLSKSRVMAGLQCHRRLWWTAHDRDAPELVPEPEQQALFDQGTRVGVAARAFVPGGALVEPEVWDPAEAVAITKLLLERGETIIYEASFDVDGVFVAIDILSRRAGAWWVTEVKSALSVKPQYIRDAAVQAWVARKHGLEVAVIEVMHLNRDYRHHDRGPLFVRADVTAKAEEFLATFAEELDALGVMLAGPLPYVAPGAHCCTPYECPFTTRCWPTLPPHHVTELYCIRGAALQRLQADGYTTIDELPEELELSGVRERQRRAVQTGTVVVDPGLAEALGALEGPIAYLDFETIAPAIPVWRGCAPYTTVPVQFSVHRRADDGTVRHEAHLPATAGDPRDGIARALLAALDGTGSVLAWNSPFERGCILHLADALPRLAEPLRALADRLVDLLPIVRNHVYHPDFRGSFSLKSVLPALVPTLGYADLEIADGMIASRLLETMLTRPDELEADPAELRVPLLAYCERDTEALVRVHDLLIELGEEGQTMT